MASETSVKLRLSVWRDFVPGNSLLLLASGEEEQRLLVGEVDLQQEVYSWQIKEDPFSGVSEEATRSRLRELLFDCFEPRLPPASRGFALLANFLQEASRAIEAGETEWTQSQDPPLDNDEEPYQLDPLLALKLQLDWLYDSFAHQPGVSVSIR